MFSSPSDIFDSNYSDESLEENYNNLDVIFSIEDEPIMTSFVRTAVKCVLNECTDQLYILRNINSQDNSNFINTPVVYMSIDDRFMGVENHADYRINSRVDNYAKLAKDINGLIFMLKTTYTEIDQHGTFLSLTEATTALQHMERDDEELLRERDRLKKHIVELRRQCEEERLYNSRTIEETDAKIQTLKFEVEDAIVYERYEVGYFENWERARREQNDMICDNKENVHNFVINDTEKKIDVENRCHMELENYVEESKNDYLDEIQYWMKRYDEETDRRESEMINLKADMEKLLEDHNHLKQTYEAHKEEMEDWLEYKRIKREKEELEQLQNWAAVKIQAWWRGTMVRKKLGPFRKKKKGKDKGKGKGKKK